MSINQKVAMTFPCQAYPDWSKTTSTPSRMTTEIGVVVLAEPDLQLGKITALAQKKNSSRLVFHWDGALAYAARCASKAKKASSEAVLVCALGKK